MVGKLLKVWGEFVDSPPSYMLSHIRQQHCWIVAFSRCLIFKCRMASLKVVGVNILSNGSSGLPDVTVLCQVSLFILEATKPSVKVSMQEYVDLICQVPVGRITRNEEIQDFLARKHSADRVEIVFASLNDNPRWDGIPWWRVVSSRGMLYDQMFHDRDEQKKMLENDGLSVVHCGAYGKSLKVDNYKDLLFKDFR